MEIYLIRHTPTATEQGLCYGQSDVALAMSFPQDMEKLCQKLPSFKPGYLVFSSPLTRCVQLAEKLSSSVICDNRLLEINFGDWENRLFNSLDTELLRHWTANFVDVAPPNGESFKDLCTRAAGFWQELIITAATQVFVITHAGIIRALLTELLQLPPANAFQFRVDCGSVHKLQYLNNYTYIHYLNL